MKVLRLLTLLALTACKSDRITLCPGLACKSGLTVHLSAMPSTPFRVELVVPDGDQIKLVYDCTGSGRCSQDVFFPDVTDRDVTVTVVVGAASRTVRVNPL